MVLLSAGDANVATGFDRQQRHMHDTARPILEFVARSGACKPVYLPAGRLLRHDTTHACDNDHMALPNLLLVAFLANLPLVMHAILLYRSNFERLI